MDNSVLIQLISTLGTICTSIITFILAPLAIRWWDNRRMKKPTYEPMFGSLPDKAEYAFTSLILGLISLFSFIIPICGMPITIVTFVFGWAGYNSSRRTLALIGMALAMLSCCANLVVLSYVMSLMSSM
jgi:uncharacterized membrane protein YdjX (TVP38/TMEM64 family)